MKLAVFGASGRTGIPLIQQALADGHEVTAFVRDPAKLTMMDEKLKIVQGDVRNPGQVEQAVVGAEVVISVLGPTNNQDDVMGPAAENLIRAMKKHNVQRLITVTGAGVEDPNDEPKLVNRFISFLLKTTARNVYEQSYRHVEKVRSSGLKWTVVRAPMLTEQPGNGSIKVGYVGKGTGTRLSREDLAGFVLTEAQRNQYVGKAPVISN